MGLPQPVQNKNTNIELLRDMVSISNNSIITNAAAKILSNSLSSNELKEVLNWIKIAKREKSSQNQIRW